MYWYRYLSIVVIAILLAACAQAATPTADPTQPPPAPPSPTLPPPPEPTIEPTATQAPPDTSTPEPVLTGDPIRGGLLYDKWWSVTGASGPTDDHPMWKLQTSNTRTGGDTWRCKECHGWDYKGVEGAYGTGSHMTGFPGIMKASAEKSPAQLLNILMGGMNPEHDFSNMLEEQDLIDLALFISETMMDYSALLNAENMSIGTADNGVEKYDQVCTNCHGPDGKAINFADLAEPEFVGHIAQDNPWEWLHKVRFGYPGWPMPSSIMNNWTDEDLANVLAYSETFSPVPALSGGGLLYDKWWTIVGMDAPVEDHPLWKLQTTNTRTGADTWRCKECHGWDYKGVDGAYGSGSHLTGFVGVLESASMSSEDILAWLTGGKNPDHDFSQLDGAALNALVVFIQSEMPDSASQINEDKTGPGDPAVGDELYKGVCAECHGDDGKALNFGDADDPEYLGTLAVDNPWEFIHKVAFGQPGEPMPAGLALGWDLDAILDVLAFAQTLPTE